MANQRTLELIDGPKVFMLAKTATHDQGIQDWLEHIGGDAPQILGNLSGAPGERLVELAARRCYKAFFVGLNPNVKRIRTDSRDYHSNILKHAHGSVMEHATITFAIEDVSRIVTHEMVRHRVGTAFSQESLRYVRFSTNLKIWVPAFIREDQYMMNNVLSLMDHAMDVYGKLEVHSDLDTTKKFQVKKWITSALRRFIPMGIATGIVITFNLRALRWFIEQRANPAAEIEVQMVADQLAQIAKREFPLVFQDMTPTPGVDELGVSVQNWTFTNRKV